MSFWDWATNLLSSDSFLTKAVPVAASVYGYTQQANATRDAANTAAQANQAGVAAQLQAINLAKKTQQAQQQQASTGLLHMQGVINNSDQLTPEQKIGVDDAKRQTLNALQGGSLRGSTRATVAAVDDIKKRTEAGYLAQNKNQANIQT